MDWAGSRSSNQPLCCASSPNFCHGTPKCSLISSRPGWWWETRLTTDVPQISPTPHGHPSAWLASAPDCCRRSVTFFEKPGWQLMCPKSPLLLMDIPVLGLQVCLTAAEDLALPTGLLRRPEPRQVDGLHMFPQALPRFPANPTQRQLRLSSIWLLSGHLWLRLFWRTPLLHCHCHSPDLHGDLWCSVFVLFQLHCPHLSSVAPLSRPSGWTILRPCLCIPSAGWPTPACHPPALRRSPPSSSRVSSDSTRGPSSGAEPYPGTLSWCPFYLMPTPVSACL